MNASQPRFLFHGEAVAFGARLKDGLLDVRGTAVLPSIGGRATGSECAYTLDHLVRFDLAGSEVVGEEAGGGGYRTRATSWMKGLRVGSVLEAAHLAVTLESRYEPGGEPSFGRLTLDVDGLAVRGQACAIDERARAWVEEHATFDALTQGFAKAGDAVKELVYDAGEGGELARASGKGLRPGAGGSISCFLIRPPQGGAKGCRPAAGGLTVTSDRLTYRFYLGEYVVSRGRRRLTLLRLELSSDSEEEPVGNGPAPVMMRTASAPAVPRGGSMTFGEVSINGASHP